MIAIRRYCQTSCAFTLLFILGKEFCVRFHHSPLIFQRQYGTPATNRCSYLGMGQRQ